MFIAAIKQHLHYKSLLVWVKNNHGSGDLKGDYAPQTEYIIYANGNGKRKLNGKRVCNVLNFKKTKNQLHPTEKPVDLLQFLIEKSTKEGETVLDCFAGSGSTGLAAKNCNRKYVLIEKDEQYFNQIVKRLD